MYDHVSYIGKENETYISQWLMYKHRFVSFECVYVQSYACIEIVLLCGRKGIVIFNKLYLIFGHLDIDKFLSHHIFNYIAQRKKTTTH